MQKAFCRMMNCGFSDFKHGKNFVSQQKDEFESTNSNDIIQKFSRFFAILQQCIIEKDIKRIFAFFHLLEKEEFHPFLWWCLNDIIISS